MALQTRGTTPQLFDNVDKDVFAIFGDTLKELPNIWRQVINVKKSDRKFERVMSMTGVGAVRAPRCTSQRGRVAPADEPRAAQP